MFKAVVHAYGQAESYTSNHQLPSNYCAKINGTNTFIRVDGTALELKDGIVVKIR
ncbi:MAG: hypothetical protein ACR2IE_16880 [Candidatus Sumerlaeaceae bacterium]